MKIAFVTGCLAPGRDGVGDYTRALAAACRAFGHECVLLALKDHEIARDEAGVLRLTNALKDRAQFAEGAAFLDRFSPDWVSFQFVHYALDPRGFVWSLVPQLKQLAREKPVHVMFHELWIGATLNAPWKERLLAIGQVAGFKRFLNELKPRAIHTSNPAYRALLARFGYRASILPMFGSVPLPKEPLPPKEERELNVLLFGTIHPVWPYKPLIPRLLEIQRPIRVVHAGRMGHGERIWDAMLSEYGDRITFERLGELSPGDLTAAFSRADVGVATTPWEIIGKSATAAAMIEHGMPVIVNRDDVHYAGWTNEGYSPLLVRMNEQLAAQIAQAKRQPAEERLPIAAGKMLQELGARPVAMGTG